MEFLGRTTVLFCEKKNNVKIYDEQSNSRTGRETLLMQSTAEKKFRFRISLVTESNAAHRQCQTGN